MDESKKDIGVHDFVCPDIREPICPHCGLDLDFDVDENRYTHYCDFVGFIVYKINKKGE